MSLTIDTPKPQVLTPATYLANKGWTWTDSRLLVKLLRCPEWKKCRSVGAVDLLALLFQGGDDTNSITGFCGAAATTGEFWPSTATLATELGADRAQVSRTLKALVDAGFLLRVGNTGRGIVNLKGVKQGGEPVTIYRINIPPSILGERS